MASGDITYDTILCGKKVSQTYHQTMKELNDNTSNMSDVDARVGEVPANKGLLYEVKN